VSAGELYAYSNGGDGKPGCPTAPEVVCSLQSALAETVPGDTVLLASPPAAEPYKGNWTVATEGTGPTAPVTIEPAPGITDPTLDGEGETGPEGPILMLTNAVSVAITGVSFVDGVNNSTSGGGAIDAGDESAGGTLTIADATFSGNTAEGDGGAIDMGDGGGGYGSLVVTGSTFTSNHGDDGGAIDAADNGGSGPVTVTSSTFTGNKGGSDGGAIDVGDEGGSATVSVSSSTFTTDQAVFGGAVDADDNSGSGSMSVTDSTFTGNTGTGTAGAIALGDHGGSATTTVTGSSFRSNVTGGDGGAIDNATSNGFSTLTVRQSSFAANRAINGGGAIDNADFSGTGTLSVAGSTFSDNTVTEYDGGAIDNADDAGSGTVSISESTFAGNTAHFDGGALDNADYGGSGTLTVSHTTFTGNHAAHGASVTSGDSGTMSATGDLFDGGCVQGAGTWADRGFNVAADGSCLATSRPATDRVSTAVSKLGPLRTYGGPTATIPLAATNPAIALIPASTTVTLDGVPVKLCPRTDQRGVAAPAGAKCDSGAMQSVADTVTGAGRPASTTVKKSVTLTARITPGSALPAAIPAPTGAVIFTVGTRIMCQSTALTARTGTTPVTVSCSTKRLPKGTDHVTVTYRSTDGYAVASRVFVEHVRPAKKKKKKKHH
jgi:predicted outer membrane repeat protein